MGALTNNIMMIRPANFGYNAETALNNAFQTKDADGNSTVTREKAQKEFDSFVKELVNVGVNVKVIEDTDAPVKPDAIFPNNWISFHDDGTIITYPMFAVNRRIERREDIIEAMELDFVVNKRYTFESYESDHKFLEGTGSMIFDRKHQIVYACLSQRTNIELLDKFAVLMGCRVIHFHAVDQSGNNIYHTNVMMALGADFVVICLESIKDESEKAELLSEFKRTNKRVIDISYFQMENFAGNMLEILGKDRKRYTIMSKSAYKSLNPNQIDDINNTSNVLPIDISTIEHYGGGSVRCMMAEIFLPKQKKLTLL